MPSSKTRRNIYVAIVGDMVRSRDVPPSQRPKVQARFQKLMDDLNERYASHVVAKFSITLGDEFQALLSTAAPIVDMTWDIEEQFSDRTLRLGVGQGTVHTRIAEFSTSMDGPAFHNARTAIDLAKKQGELGGVFRGFQSLDQVLDGIARILWFHRSQFTKQQHKIVSLLRKNDSQSEIAQRLQVSRQAISKHVHASGWPYYFEAEQSFRILLRDYAK